MTSTATPSVAFESAEVTLHHGDCLDVLAGLPDCSVDSVVTDPPYGLANTDPAHVAETITRWVNGERDYLPGGTGFMGKSWDAFVPPVAVWDECLRVLKPGGHVLAFAGSRTVDLMTLGLRLAGFDIRDSIAWLYGSGFPKSLDVSKAIDKMHGAEPEVIGFDASRYRDVTKHTNTKYNTAAYPVDYEKKAQITTPATDDARKWEGWGTALKPAFEPVVVARKPLQGTVAANVLAHGTGALNIDASRIGNETIETKINTAIQGGNFARAKHDGRAMETTSHVGRFPANVILDESQAAELDKQAPDAGGSGKASGPSLTGASTSVARGKFNGVEDTPFYGDKGGASRFFYTAKADSAERPVVDGIAHPTVKPLDLMRYLVRLVTPKGGVVLEPFAGSGTTLEAAVLEGFRAIGIEREADYIPLIMKRLDKPHEVGLDLFGDVA